MRIYAGTSEILKESTAAPQHFGRQEGVSWVKKRPPSAASRPLRGTRPPHRRQLIVEAATRLFAERGYEHVSVGDIAAEVEVGPSALYRHFSGKEQILVEAIGVVVGHFTEIIGAAADPRDLLLQTAGFALDRREVGLLWEREARHLPPESYADALDQIRSARTAFARAVHAGEGQDIQASAALSVLLSPSFHHTDLPRPGYEGVLAELAERVLNTTLPVSATKSETPQGLRRSSAREQLVATAITLFADRTYASVSMEDIAQAVGKATSSIYSHLPSKHELLHTALTRGDGYLQMTLDLILARSPDAQTALADLVDSYTTFAVGSPAVIDVLITEVRNLPDKQAEGLRQDQRVYVDEWVHLLRQLHPGMDRATARATVHATLMMINDLARTPSTRSRTDAEHSLAVLARRLLDV